MSTFEVDNTLTIGDSFDKSMFSEIGEELSHDEIIKKFGVECLGNVGPDGIKFIAGHWHAGGEYVHKLVIRNVTTKNRKIKYKLPKTRYFSMPYPEVITLSPGMSKIVEVVFRPVQYEPYDDCIVIKLVEGELHEQSRSFRVNVKAAIEKLIITAPYGIDLGYCSAFQNTIAIFQLTNAGEKEAPFRWETPMPFTIQPMSGSIPAGQVQDIVVSLIPEDASVFVSKAVCFVGENVQDAIIESPILTVKISAISKYPHITLSESDINFGEVLCGTTPKSITKEIILRNNSVVVAEWDVSRVEKDLDEVFELSQKQGVLKPQSETTISIAYSALAMGIFSLDTFIFRTPSNCITTLTCRGMSISPSIQLMKETRIPNATFQEGSPANSINFRDIEIGGVVTKIFMLKNGSNQEVHFSVNDIEPMGGIFQVIPRQGIIPPLTESFSVRVMFRPKHPINYYRRLFILMNNCHPLFFDVYGTGYIIAHGETKEQRPAPLRHAHIQAYKNRLIDGYADIPSTDLENMTNLSHMKSEYFAQVGTQGTKTLLLNNIAQPLSRSGNVPRDVSAVAEEMFIEQNDDSCNVVVLNESCLDFGFTRYMTRSMSKSITIRNRTMGKVTLFWNIPLSQSYQNNDNHDMNDDLSMSSTTTMQPPGSRQSNRRPSAAKIMDYDHNVDFTVEPSMTDINPNETATFRVTFCPKQSNRNFVSKLEAYAFFKNQRTFNLVSDIALTPPWCIVLTAIGHTFETGKLLAKANLTGGGIKNGKLTFPSCYLHDSLYATVMLHNTSDLPCSFNVTIGFDSDETTSSTTTIANNTTRRPQSIFSTVPSSGIIEANSFAIICLRFSPKDLKKYTDYVNFLINGEVSSKTRLMVEGTCSIPFVYCPSLIDENSDGSKRKALAAASTNGIRRNSYDAKLLYIPNGPQGVLYMKPTCVGLTTVKDMLLKNGSRLPVQFSIKIPKLLRDILIANPASGVIKGNDTINIKLSFSPIESKEIEYPIIIQTFSVSGHPKRIVDARQIGNTGSPELLQSLEINVVLPGDRGCITYNPSNLDFDVRLVGTSETKEIWLENISSVDLSYELFYITKFTIDKGEECSTHKDVLESNLRMIYKTIKDAEMLDSLSHNEFEHCLFCEYPSGVLSARSKKRVLFTFLPNNAGKFEFQLSAYVKTVDESGIQNSYESDTVTLKSNNEIAKIISKQNQNEKHKNKRTMVLAEHFNNVPLIALVSGRAAFPTVSILDARVHDTLSMNLSPSVESLWKRFSLEDLNKFLAIPLTEKEIKLYKQSSPDLTQLQRYKFEFTPMVMGSPAQFMYFKIKNTGYLKTSFRLILANEKTLDLEQWCDEDEPSKELNEIISIIEEIKCFHFEPTSAVLYPGEECTLMISYKAKSLKYNGLHRLPLMIKIEQGKMLYFDLIGQTIPMDKNFGGYDNHASNVNFNDHTTASAVTDKHPQTASVTNPSGILVTAAVSASTNISNILLTCPEMTQDKQIKLSPVTIGIPFEHVPLQRVQIFNPSQLPIKYEVSMQHIIHLNTINFNQKILHIANPEGIIPPQSVHYLEIYFHPIQMKKYIIPIEITYQKNIPILAPIETLFDDGMSGLSNDIGSTNNGALRPVISRAKSSSSRNSTMIRTNSSKSMRSTSSKGGRKAVLAANNINTTLETETQLEYLTFILCLEGIDPRQSKPVIETLFAGQYPPDLQLVSLPGQLITMSTDIFDFDRIAQNSMTQRFFLIENQSDKKLLITFDLNLSLLNTYTNQAVAFVEKFNNGYSDTIIDKSEILTIFPANSTLLPGERTFFEIKIKACCAPVIFNERIGIIAREVIKESDPWKKVSMASRILNKYKKKASPIRENTIAQLTTAVESHNDSRSGTLPGGRISRTPSTVGATNNTVLDYDAIRVQRKLSTSSMLSGMSADDSVLAGQTSGSRADTGSINRPSSGEGDYGNNDNVSIGAYSAVSRGSHASGMTGVSRGSQFSRTGTSASGITSRTGSRADSAGEGRQKGPSYGATSLLTLRIKGEIVAAGTFKALQSPSIDLMTKNSILYSSNWLEAVSTSSIIPSSLPYIINNTSNKISSVHNNTLTPFHGTNSLTVIDENTGEVTINTQDMIQDVIPSKPSVAISEVELRLLTENVLSQVFQDVLNLPGLSKYSRLVAYESLQATQGLKLQMNNEIEVDQIDNLTTNVEVVGNSSSNIYFKTISKTIVSNVDTKSVSSKSLASAASTSRTITGKILNETEITTNCQDILADAISRSILDIFNEVTSSKEELVNT